MLTSLHLPGVFLNYCFDGLFGLLIRGNRRSKSGRKDFRVVALDVFFSASKDFFLLLPPPLPSQPSGLLLYLFIFKGARGSKNVSEVDMEMVCEVRLEVTLEAKLGFLLSSFQPDHPTG